jgi:hypothetical protein
VGTHEPTQSTSQQAQFVTFELMQTYSNFAVRDVTHNQNVGRVWVRADGIVSKIEFSAPVEITATTTNTRELLDIDQALERIKQGGGQVTLQSTPGSYKLIDLRSYTQIELDTVSLELRISENDVVEPYFVFSGGGYQGGNLITPQLEVIVKATK